ncbi:MAG: glycosyltransferase family 39 protein [Elusimicrobiota bacterium]
MKKSSPLSRHLPFALLAAVWLAFQASTLLKFPHVNWDENMEANHSWNFARTGENVYTLYEDVYPDRLAFLQYSTPNVIRPFYNGSEGVFFRVFGAGIYQARAFSLLAGLAALACVYAAGMLLAGRAAGFGAALWLSTRFVFLHGTREGRPDALLALGASLAVLLYLMGEKRASVGWKFASGLAAGLLPGIHTNGLAPALALGVLSLQRLDQAKPRRLTAAWALGGAAGAAAYFSCADLGTFLLGWKMFKGFFSYQAPVMGGLAALPGAFLGEFQRFFGGANVGYEPVNLAVRAALSADALAIGLAVLVPYFTPSDAKRRDAAAAVLLCQFFYALFVANKNPNYSIVAYVLAAPLAGSLLGSRPPAWVKRGFLALAVAAGAAAAWEIPRRMARSPSYKETAAALRRHVPPGARVIGPQTFWLALKDRDYRDLGGLAFRRWLTAETTGVTEGLKTFRPSWLIVDHHFRGIFLKGGSLDDILAVPHEKTGEVDGGPFYGRPLEIYRLDWPEEKGKG